VTVAVVVERLALYTVVQYKQKCYICVTRCFNGDKLQRLVNYL
jgi:hypothetical protein